MTNGLRNLRVVAGAVAAGALTLLGSVPVSAETSEVYVHTGEHGETSFTDQAVPGAERVTLDAPEPPPNASEELERRIRQTLEVADALEESRLARERARAEARAAEPAATPAPQVIYQDRYVSPYAFGPWFRGRDGFHGRDRFRHHDRFDRREHRRDHRPAREQTISKPFPYDPD